MCEEIEGCNHELTVIYEYWPAVHRYLTGTGIPETRRYLQEIPTGTGFAD